MKEVSGFHYALGGIYITVIVLVLFVSTVAVLPFFLVGIFCDAVVKSYKWLLGLLLLMLPSKKELEARMAKKRNQQSGGGDTHVG